MINLADQIKRMRGKYPDAVPLVELGAAPMSTKYGRKSKPTLKVVGWQNTDASVMVAAGAAAPPPRRSRKWTTKSRSSPSHGRANAAVSFFGAVMSDSSPNLTAALALAGAGVKIFPAGADKRPLFSGWQEIATTERDIISDWWRRAPYALPAIPCGVNGLLVIDLDRHGNGSDGVSAFKALVARHGALPPGVPMVKTPNNGFHLYFRQPPGEPLGNGRGNLPAGCDVRGAGGFVIGPGAVLPDGRGWIRVAERPPVTQAAQLVWIESILRPPRRTAA